jgi:hypothetical protein
MISIHSTVLYQISDQQDFVQHVHVHMNKDYIPDQDMFVRVVLISFVYQIYLVLFLVVVN